MEYNTVAFVKRHVRPGMTVLDVGAHIGYYSLLLSDLVGKEGHVFAFEPFSDNRATLTRNLRRRKHGNVVTVIPKAVSNQEGIQPLFVAKGHSAHSMVIPSPISEQVDVEVTTLDHFLPTHNIQHVDLVKIDAEGAEPRIIDGMLKTIQANPKLIIIIECNETALNATGMPLGSFLTHLQTLGFDCLPLGKDAGHKSGTQNYACIPISLRIIEDVHYGSSTYLSKKRWMSYWAQINAVKTYADGKRVLEIGPGNNIVGHALHGMGYEITTADNDPKTNPDYLTDIRSISTKVPERFDLILCCQLLEHISFEDFEPCLHELKKIGKKRLIITLPFTTLGTLKTFGTIKLPFLKEFRWLWILNLFPQPHQINRIDGHQWEIGKKGYTLKRVITSINQSGWKVKVHEPIFENPYHYLFVCEMEP